MTKQIFVNLPIKDLVKSKEFFSKLGYTYNEQFTNDDAACMVVSDTIYVMLLTEPFFKTFIKKGVSDTKTGAEVITAFSAKSKDEVNQMLQKAIDAGGIEFKEPYDYGFMYGRSFEDLDGHIWEYFWMDPNHAQ